MHSIALAKNLHSRASLMPIAMCTVYRTQKNTRSQAITSEDAFTGSRQFPEHTLSSALSSLFSSLHWRGRVSCSCLSRLCKDFPLLDNTGLLLLEILGFLIFLLSHSQAWLLFGHTWLAEFYSMNRILNSLPCPLGGIALAVLLFISLLSLFLSFFAGSCFWSSLWPLSCLSLQKYWKGTASIYIPEVGWIHGKHDDIAEGLRPETLNTNNSTILQAPWTAGRLTRRFFLCAFPAEWQESHACWKYIIYTRCCVAEDVLWGLHFQAKWSSKHPEYIRLNEKPFSYFSV